MAIIILVAFVRIGKAKNDFAAMEKKSEQNNKFSSNTTLEKSLGKGLQTPGWLNQEVLSKVTRLSLYLPYSSTVLCNNTVELYPCKSKKSLYSSPILPGQVASQKQLQRFFTANIAK